MLSTCNVLVKCMQEIVIIINNVNNITNEPKNKDFIFLLYLFFSVSVLLLVKARQNWLWYK